MKTMKIFSVIALLMMGAFTFTSCSDDDDNNGTASNLALMDEEAVEKAIVGTWTFTESWMNNSSSGTTSGVNTGTMEFNERGLAIITETNGDSDGAVWRVYPNGDGTFGLSIVYVVGNKIGDEVKSQISFLSTTTLILTYNDVYDNFTKKGTVTFKRIK